MDDRRLGVVDFVVCGFLLISLHEISPLVKLISPKMVDLCFTRGCYYGKMVATTTVAKATIKEAIYVPIQQQLQRGRPLFAALSQGVYGSSGLKRYPRPAVYGNLPNPGLQPGSACQADVV